MNKEKNIIELLKIENNNLKKRLKIAHNINVVLRAQVKAPKDENVIDPKILDSIIDIVKYAANRLYKVDIELRVRHREVIDSRLMYYGWLRKNTNLSLKAMSRTLTLNHDHSTIIHSLRKHDELLDYNRGYQKDWQLFCESVEFLKLKLVNEGKELQDMSTEVSTEQTAASSL